MIFFLVLLLIGSKNGSCHQFWNKIYVFVLGGNVRKCVYEIVNMRL